MSDPQLSDAVLRYTWNPRGATPGRHLENVGDDQLRRRVSAIVAELDGIRPNTESFDLFAWSDERAGELGGRHDIDSRAVDALAALLSWTWR